MHERHISAKIQLISRSDGKILNCVWLVKELDFLITLIILLTILCHKLLFIKSNRCYIWEVNFSIILLFYLLKWIFIDPFSVTLILLINNLIDLLSICKILSFIFIMHWVMIPNWNDLNWLKIIIFMDILLMSYLMRKNVIILRKSRDTIKILAFFLGRVNNILFINLLYW